MNREIDFGREVFSERARKTSTGMPVRRLTKDEQQHQT
jgi:hypothetical protein